MRNDPTLNDRQSPYGQGRDSKSLSHLVAELEEVVIKRGPQALLTQRALEQLAAIEERDGAEYRQLLKRVSDPLARKALDVAAKTTGKLMHIRMVCR